MKHEIKEKDGTVIVAFEGDIDMQSSPEARKVLLECLKKKTPLLVSLAGVTYIDSSGVASLVEALQTARKTACKFALVAVSDGARRVLKLARLDKVFAIHDTVEDGIAKLK